MSSSQQSRSPTGFKEKGQKILSELNEACLTIEQLNDRVQELSRSHRSLTSSIHVTTMEMAQGLFQRDQLHNTGVGSIEEVSSMSAGQKIQWWGRVGSANDVSASLDMLERMHVLARKLERMRLSPDEQTLGITHSALPTIPENQHTLKRSTTKISRP